MPNPRRLIANTRNADDTWHYIMMEASCIIFPQVSKKREVREVRERSTRTMD